MTRSELLELHPGRCVIGFAGIKDELPLVRVDPSRKQSNGLLSRFVAVQYGSIQLRGSIVEGEDEILSETHDEWPQHIRGRGRA